MKPSNLQTRKRDSRIYSIRIFRAKVLNLKQGLALNDKSERHAKLLLSTFPQRWKGFLFAKHFVLYNRFFLFHR